MRGYFTIEMSFGLKFIASFLFSSLLTSLKATCDTVPVVVTKNGQISGTTDSFSYMYLGIPYARPPVDDLRWEEPIHTEPWYPNVLNATKFMPACYQLNCGDLPSNSCPPTVSNK